MTEIEVKKLSDLKPDNQNANRGTERGRAMLESSLRQWGAGRSILLDRKGRIIAGNKTFEEAGQIGLEDVVVVRTKGDQLVAVLREDLDLSDEATGARELAYADNRVGQVSLDWEPEQMLADLDAGLDLTQFWSEGELNAILAGLQPEPKPDPGPQVDKAAELAAKWGTQSGQVWQLGEHRLAVGDCTDKAVVEAVMRGERADYLFTDPPYGIEIDTSWLSALNMKRGKPANKSDDKLTGDDGTLDLTFLFEFDRRMIWGFPYIFDPMATGWVVWDKQPGVNGRGIVTPIEMASTTLRKGFDMIRVMWGGYYRASGETREPHPTQKPTGVVLPFIEKWTNESEIVHDPFLGSGTTLIACELLKRKCRAIEIDPGYCAVTLQRWADLTGQEPALL